MSVQCQHIMWSSIYNYASLKHLPFEMKIDTPVSPALRIVHTNFVCFFHNTLSTN